MTEATGVVTVAQAINRIIADLPAIGKDGVNRDQHYNFRGIEQLTREVAPLLVKHGVTIVPSDRRIISEVHTSKSGGNLFRVLLEANWNIIGPDGMGIFASSVGEGTDSSDKATNKASTSAYKYLLLQLFCVCDPGDDGDATTPPETAKRATKSTATTKLESPYKDTLPPVKKAEPVKDEEGAVDPRYEDESDAPFANNEDAVAALEANFPGTEVTNVSETPIVLSQVSYDNKDEAKAFGARWDGKHKQWYVPAGVELTPFYDNDWV